MNMKKIGTVLLFTVILCSMGMTATAEDPPTNEELMAVLNELTQKIDNITIHIEALDNQTADNFEDINETLNNVNFTGVTNLGTDLEIISHELADIQERLGYPMNEPNATIYDDLTLLLEGLTYEDGGSVQWILKNDTGQSQIVVLRDNQLQLGNNQVHLQNRTEDIEETIEESEGDVKSAIRSNIDEVLGSNGTNLALLVVLLIIGLFFIAWKFFLQQRFAVETAGRPTQQFTPEGRPNIEGAGRPACYGDANKFDPGNDPDCVSCPWVNKCQATILRNSENEPEQSGFDPKYDYNGNIVAILSEGQPIQLPPCFGKDFDRGNRDCQQCAIAEMCMQQQQKNKQIQAPPQPTADQQMPSRNISRRGAPIGNSAAGSDDILSQF